MVEACAQHQFTFVIRQISCSHASACVFVNDSVILFSFSPVFAETNNFNICPILTFSLSFVSNRAFCARKSDQVKEYVIIFSTPTLNFAIFSRTKWTQEIGGYRFGLTLFYISSFRKSVINSLLMRVISIKWTSFLLHCARLFLNVLSQARSMYK